MDEVLVVGGTGFIGRWCLAQFLEMTASRTFDGRIQLLEYVPAVLSGPPGTEGGLNS